MFLLALDSLDNLEEIYRARPDGVIVGVKGFSVRSRAHLDAEDFAKAVQEFEEHGIALFANMQAMLEEKDVEKAREALRTVLQAGAAGVYIADDGYITLADEISENPQENLRTKLIMQPETLLASGEDAAFYLNQSLQAAALSHELTLQEIEAAAQTISEQNSVRSNERVPGGLDVLIAGYYSWMESRRPLLLNYLRFTGDEESFQDGKVYTIQEQQRDFRLPIIQDEKGTHVFSNQPMQAARDYLAMKAAGIQRFRIDAALKGNAWGLEMLERYRALEAGSEDAFKPEDSTLFEEESLIKKEREVVERGHNRGKN